jgi:carbohydrate-selective porin OprB
VVTNNRNRKSISTSGRAAKNRKISTFGANISKTKHTKLTARFQDVGKMVLKPPADRRENRTMGFGESGVGRSALSPPV